MAAFVFRSTLELSDFVIITSFIQQIMLYKILHVQMHLIHISWWKSTEEKNMDLSNIGENT